SYVEPEYLALINITDVDNIEVLKSVGYTGIYGMRGTAGVLIINTKRGESETRSKISAKGIASYSPQGYYIGRQFYSPSYAEPEINKIADLRSTIYWAPNVITDVGGKGSVNFYTSDQPGTYKAVIEGVDLNGSLSRQVFRFNVAK
ncbi:MAG TPA: TonB-dependent receptor, partial [Pedobacter sp.]